VVSCVYDATISRILQLSAHLWPYQVLVRRNFVGESYIAVVQGTTVNGVCSLKRLALATDVASFQRTLFYPNQTISHNQKQSFTNGTDLSGRMTCLGSIHERRKDWDICRDRQPTSRVMIEHRANL
jgi:hypothetical protein